VTRGAIVLMGSAASYVASPSITPYTTSKHAVLGLSKSAGQSILNPDTEAPTLPHPIFPRCLDRRSTFLFVNLVHVHTHSSRQRSAWHSRKLPVSHVGRHAHGAHRNGRDARARAYDAGGAAHEAHGDGGRGGGRGPLHVQPAIELHHGKRVDPGWWRNLKREGLRGFLRLTAWCRSLARKVCWAARQVRLMAQCR
jgi:hypothetical protein